MFETNMNTAEYLGILNKAALDSKQTKETVFAFSNGKTFLIYNPLSAKHCIEEQERTGAVLIGKFRDGLRIF